MTAVSFCGDGGTEASAGVPDRWVRRRARRDDGGDEPLEEVGGEQGLPGRPVLLDQRLTHEAAGLDELGVGERVVDGLRLAPRLAPASAPSARADAGRPDGPRRRWHGRARRRTSPPGEAVHDRQAVRVGKGVADRRVHAEQRPHLLGDELLFVGLIGDLAVFLYLHDCLYTPVRMNLSSHQHSPSPSEPAGAEMSRSGGRCAAPPPAGAAAIPPIPERAAKAARQKRQPESRPSSWSAASSDERGGYSHAVPFAGASRKRVALTSRAEVVF